MEQILLSRAESGRRLGLSVQTIDRLIKAGLLRVYRLSPRRLGISLASIQDYVQGQALSKQAAKEVL